MTKKTKEIYLKIYKTVSELEDLMFQLDDVEALEAITFVFKFLEDRKKYAEDKAHDRFIYLKTKND